MIFIINSPLFKEKNPRYDEDSLPPIGLGYIATKLQNSGFDVKLIDSVTEQIPLSELISILDKEKPEFIASNIFTTNYQLVKELFERTSFKTHFIIGGLSAKDLYKEIVTWKTENPIDVVIGDGELIVPDLISDKLIEAPVFHAKNRRVFNVFSSSRYYLNDIDNVPLDRSFFKNEPIIHPFGFQEVNIIASRGCIFNCTFCAAARSVNQQYGIRERSSNSLIDELSRISELYPRANSIRILDDLFLKNSRSIELAINVFSNFNFHWRSMAHVTTFNRVDDSVLLDLVKSGCNELFIGIESGSPKILKSINKTSNLETIIRNLTAVLKAGISIKGYFIYGFPDETIEDMELTYQLALKLKSVSHKYRANFRTSVFQYRPYHGTAFYHDLKLKGIDTDAKSIVPDDELSELIGRLQFNFHSGNHSRVALPIVRDYIYRTTNLTDSGILHKIKPSAKPKKSKTM